ncbi:MAG TPA: efflux RND transporter permease subunit [Terriglobales bacterium]|nr:efflux RND transporter permease subunit [Terriglobales bacterium]
MALLVLSIVAMTVSLAAVFIPLVFMSGLMGRIFREFSITIVISILASGLVSLTLTPLMTSRMLDNRGEGSKKTRMERAFGAVERHVLTRYGSSFATAGISATAWVLCLAGNRLPTLCRPESFPIGDSSFIRGVMVTQEISAIALNVGFCDKKRFRDVP